ncbi:YukJ family protein [Archangium primigenium]|uniref:YukJ family protein n=1 Tax=[Archangium] primigenium TaxID=2792470 RepID=UPI0019594F3C|nr:YukJ family protein [Archangium primigenium]MBM7116527.1 YukJ family protein [Archangium primigenium]
MSIPRYGLLVAQAVEGKPATNAFAHYQVIARDPTSGEPYQIDINVRSQDGSEVLYSINESFQNALTDALSRGARDGINALDSVPGSLSIDYLRSGLFPVSAMKPLGMETPPKQDLNDLIGGYIQRAIQTQGARLYAFGQYFDDAQQPGRARRSSNGPSKGIHDIHMNQGNAGRWERDNGTYQDGGLLISYPGQGWVAIFLAFQVQSFQTNDANGDPTGPSWAQLHGGEVYEEPGTSEAA